MAKKSYKVWVEIEEFVDGEPVPDILSTHGTLPDSVGVFEGKGALAQAQQRVALIVNQFGIDPENSDCVKSVRKQLVKEAKYWHWGKASRS